MVSIPGCEQDEDLLATLRLARSERIGPSTFRRLVREHGSAQRALEALPSRAARAGQRGYRPAEIPSVRAEMSRAADAGAAALILGRAPYPQHLAALEDAPAILWAIGRVELLASSGIAIVGARNASAIGQRFARDLAAGIGAAGHVVVSGLARGIDTAAHEASAPTGTIAILAGGVDVIYPRQNTGLYHRLAAEGLILSEAPMGFQPLARHFPKRNRIVSGLSRAVVLIEAAERSGSLITARLALEQGREVMAAPGNPFDPRAAGCNALIRQGATLVRDARDVLDELDTGPRPHLSAEAAFHETTGLWLGDEPLPETLHQTVQGLVSTTPIPEDVLIRQLGEPAAVVLAALTDLELAGAIRRHPGGMVSAP
ncbi:MAG: DNA-processing protein DprA [Rubricella sp.]